MSMYLEFEPHSWYMGAAIQKLEVPYENGEGVAGNIWNGYLENGWNYSIVEFSALTLKDLKQQIKEYRYNEAKRIARLYVEVTHA